MSHSYNGFKPISLFAQVLRLFAFLKRRNSPTDESAGKSASLWQTSENEKDSPIGRTHTQTDRTHEKKCNLQIFRLTAIPSCWSPAF